jgi:hypothetical protein
MSRADSRALVLTRHPSTPCDAVRTIDARVTRAGANLSIAYALEADLEALRVPPERTAHRVDGLWRQTCLEAFIGAGAAGYYEFNFAPSGEWAVYRFSGYRAGMAAAGAAPATRIARTAGGFTLDATLDLALLQLPSPARLALAAVIEEASGRLSYWALAHPPGKPDFHHSDSFSLEI